MHWQNLKVCWSPFKSALVSCRYFFSRNLSAARRGVSNDTVLERLNIEWAFRHSCPAPDYRKVFLVHVLLVALYNTIQVDLIVSLVIIKQSTAQSDAQRKE